MTPCHRYQDIEISESMSYMYIHERVGHVKV